MSLRKKVYDYIQNNAAILPYITDSGTGNQNIYFGQVPSGFAGLGAIVYYSSTPPISDIDTAIIDEQIIGLEVYAKSGETLDEMMRIIKKMFDKRARARGAFAKDGTTQIFSSKITSGSEDLPFVLENITGFMNTISITFRISECDE